MLPRLGRGRLDLCRCFRQAGQGTQLPNVVERYRMAVCQNIRIVQRFLGGHVRLARYPTVFNELFEPFIGSPLLHAAQHDLPIGLFCFERPCSLGLIVWRLFAHFVQAGDSQVPFVVMGHEIRQLHPPAIPGLHRMVIEFGHGL